MRRTPTRVTEVEAEGRQACAGRHRSVAFVELITTAALALSTAVAATAVSIGMARAEACASTPTSESAAVVLALGVALLLWAAPMLRAIIVAVPRPN